MELKQQFSEITTLITKAKAKAYHAVNKELVNLYWNVGEYVSKQVAAKAWGKSIVKELADFIQISEPNVIGFSSQNIWRMKQFYETYASNEKLATLSRELSWSHNRLIIPLEKNQEKEFYLRMSLKENWSVRELERQINSSYYERVMLADSKLARLSRELPQNITNTFKDTYIFELLQIPEEHHEKELSKSISSNITKFLLEFGRDFAFMGEEYPLQVGNQDFAIDLLFYNRSLNCMVAIELKNERFKPEHLGQLNFYLEALDQDVKKEHENPSIGILLCKGKDDTVVEYAMNRSLSPTLIADYKTKLPNKALLQQKWEEVLANLESETNNENTN
jgi:predicted nuclease of restriction endonuclease-like (RecB) superfamily